MLLNSLQENLLTLLAFDAVRAPTIRQSIELARYGGPYRVLAARIYSHLDHFKQPPGDHLPDILADKLEGKDKDEAAIYEDIIHSLHQAKPGINAEYVMTQMMTFIKRQSLRSLAIDFAKAVQRDTDDSLEEAEALLASANKQVTSVFDPGVRLSDKRVLSFLDLQQNAFPTGIAELDKRGFGPTRKELWMLIANSSAGKSWALSQLAKAALMSQLRVCHITLEMSWERAAQRYFQALFAIAKRKGSVNVKKFRRDTLGRIQGIDDTTVTPSLSFDDPGIRKKLERRIDRWANRVLDNIIVKEFPTGALTINQLKAYLDNLEQVEKFVPDLLIVDYPDLMKLDRDNLRLDLDQTYKELRGIAVSRNIALGVVSQSHRSAAKSKLVGMENVAEAYTKIAHADVVITYSQTKKEQEWGLARLHVAKGRNDQDKFTIVISQAYATGQFVIDSNLMVGTYWENIPEDQ